MAKCVSFVEVTLRVAIGTPPNETLDYNNAKMRYAVCDETDHSMAKGASDVAVTTIVPTDTVAAWFAKVVDQVKTAEGIA